MPMDLTALPSVILAVAQARSLDLVLETIVNAIVHQPEIALARIWLLQRDADCLKCCGSRNTSAMHLLASGGASLSGEQWTLTNGAFHRVALDAPVKLARNASTGEPMFSPALAGAPWLADPEWVAREQILGFMGQPLVFKDQVLGVIAIFTRITPTEQCFGWLR